MAGTVFKKIGMVLLTMLKWMLQSALLVLKLALGMVKLFLLLLILVTAVVFAVTGIPVGRR